jgi:hypothetical protein
MNSEGFPDIPALESTVSAASTHFKSGLTAQSPIAEQAPTR